MVKNSYLKVFLLSVQENLTFRIDFLIRFFTSFIQSYASVAIWYAIATTNIIQLSDIQISDTIKYMILTTGFLDIYLIIPWNEISEKVSKGTIDRDLLYPVFLPLNILCKCLGLSFVALLTRVIPTLIILSVFFWITWSFSLLTVGLFFFGIIMGYFIYFLLNLLVDLLSFWLLETFSLQNIRIAIVLFLSGIYIPLWYYPDWLLSILDYLPFKFIIYVPIAFYLEKITLLDYLRQLGIVSIWILIFGIICLLLWNRGTKKVVAHGG
jgi:ABC-2 type transport system permease protein